MIVTFIQVFNVYFHDFDVDVMISQFAETKMHSHTLIVMIYVIKIMYIISSLIFSNC